MAAPKKRQSKTRKNLRKAQWKAQAATQAQKALATAKMVLKSLSSDLVPNESSKEQTNEQL